MIDLLAMKSLRDRFYHGGFGAFSRALSATFSVETESDPSGTRIVNDAQEERVCIQFSEENVEAIALSRQGSSRENDTAPAEAAILSTGICRVSRRCPFIDAASQRELRARSETHVGALEPQ